MVADLHLEFLSHLLDDLDQFLGLSAVRGKHNRTTLPSFIGVRPNLFRIAFNVWNGMRIPAESLFDEPQEWTKGQLTIGVALP
jgi:hypothetical protein